MSQQSVITTPVPTPESNSSPASVSTGTIGFAWLSGIFAVAAALRLWFNFGTAHSDIAFSCDAAEYLRNAQTLASIGHFPQSFWSQAVACLAGTAPPEAVAQVRNAFHDFKDFFISGPIFPLYLLSSYALTGSACEITNWAPPVAVQCVVTALSCVLIALIGNHCWDKKTGITAGFIAAFYPAFVLNSGRLYSESFACFLLCLTVWLTVRAFTSFAGSPWTLLATGFTALALQLTRSIMFVLSAALFPITFFQHRSGRPWLAVLILFAGCTFVALPWLGLQHLAFGKGSLVVDRVGHYNFFTGNNINAQGWLSYPYPDMTGIEQKSFLTLAKESFKQSPTRWIKLMLDKPLRLFKFPWNDFRTSIGPISMYVQVLLHQTVMLLAGLGLMLAFAAQPGAAPEKRQIYSRTFVAALILFQCVYLAFITVPRYNLTIMPLLILFTAAGVISMVRLTKISSIGRSAAVLIFSLALFFAVQKCDLLPHVVGLTGATHANSALVITVLVKAATLAFLVWSIWRLLPSLNGNTLAARVITILLAIFTLPSLCLPLRAHGRWQEWQCRLDSPGQKVSQNINLPSGKLSDLQSRQCYLLIDSDGAAPLNNGVNFKVDGSPIEPVVIPNLPFLQDLRRLTDNGQKNLYLEGEYIFECLTYAASISNLDLRQWFLLPIPPSIIEKHSEGQPLQVELAKTNGSGTTIYGNYDSDSRLAEIPDPALYSWEKAFYGVENDRGFTDTRLDTKIAIEKGSVRTDDLSPAPGLQSGRYSLRLLAAPAASDRQHPYLTNLIRLPLVSNLEVSSGRPPSSLRVSNLPEYKQSDCWLVRISGKATAGDGPLNASIRVAAHSTTAGGARYSYDSPWAPRSITAASGQSSFNVAFPLVPSALTGKLKELAITFLPPSGTATTGQPVHFQNVTIELDRLPSLPMNAGYLLL